MPEVNAEAMGHHLKVIAPQVAPGGHAVLICDGAGWHQAGGRLRVPDNITLLLLPPYSPELNPMENVWHYCAKTFSAPASGTHTTTSSTPASTAWRFLIEDPQRIRKTTLGAGQSLRGLV